MYEYPWAIRFALAGETVADMGCGYEARPFKDALAKRCAKVYAVDIMPEVRKLKVADNVQIVVADISQRIEAIADNSLDRVFCISVLEHMGGAIPGALAEFYRCLKPGGSALVTCDVRYDDAVDTTLSGGVDIEYLLKHIAASPFGPIEADTGKSNVMYSDLFNLCVFRGELIK